MLAVALDVTEPERSVAAVEAAVAGFGRLDVVVNTARYVNVAPIEDVDDADFRAQVETNLWGAVNVTRAALPALRAQRSGRIIQFSRPAAPRRSRARPVRRPRRAASRDSASSSRGSSRRWAST